MDKKTQESFEVVNNHIEAKKIELELLIKKINRYKYSQDGGKWLKLKRGDKLRLLKIKGTTAKLDREDLVIVKSVDFYPEEEERRIGVHVYCKKESNNYNFKMICEIETHKREWVDGSEGKQILVYSDQLDMSCFCSWNFEFV